MGSPVVHFEVVGKDGEAPSRSSGDLWSAAAASLAAVAALAASAAAPAGAAPAFTQCRAQSGFTVYANGVACAKARSVVGTLSALPYRSAKVTIRSVPGYVCVASYRKATRRMVAGSCLRSGTTAKGFGWTRDGATVPLPPGANG